MRELLQTSEISRLFVPESADAQQTASQLFLGWGLNPEEHRLESVETCLQALKDGRNSLVVCPSGLAPSLFQGLGISASAPKSNELYTVSLRSDSTELEVSHFGYLPTLRRVSVEGSVYEQFDLSGIALTDGGLFVAADEQASVQFMPWEADNLKAGRVVALPADGEVDVEGLATDEDNLYVLGSHSHRRRNVDPIGDKSRKRSWVKNRKRFLASEIRTESSRDRLYRLNFASGEISSLNLRELLDSHPVLAPYTTIPSKENGVDLEGLAFDGQSLFVGCRGPVLRSGFVPVLRLHYDEPGHNNVLFVNLAGRGIRDITKVDDGFLILAGPVGDSTLSYQLYHWDGGDCMPGTREPGDEEWGKTTLLGTVPTASGNKAEGLAVLKSSVEAYELLVVFDGAEAGALTVFKVERCSQPHRHTQQL